MPANAAGRAAPWAGRQLHGRTLPAGILVALIGTPTSAGCCGVHGPLQHRADVKVRPSRTPSPHLPWQPACRPA